VMFLKNIICKAGWQSFLSNCYEFSSNKVSWQTARLYCSGQGTLLLILGNDSREWDFIVQRTVLSSESYWIGLTDAITGHWRWVDGTPYTMNSRHYRTFSSGTKAVRKGLIGL
uniref:C-type lectin domain-containing protein n=1 Tax=Sinocyclocheilus rhinocerous TaxID=307959 RepID=A0A673FTD0_9TELE